MLKIIVKVDNHLKWYVEKRFQGTEIDVILLNPQFINMQVTDVLLNYN